jgi:hypothetical protein
LEPDRGLAAGPRPAAPSRGCLGDRLAVEP